MSKFFVKENQIENNKVKIIGDDVNHIKNVLRLNVDEMVIICNENTSENYECKILSLAKEYVECEIISKLSSLAESKVHISVYQGLPKADKMELIIQKSTELGAKEFIPVALKRSIVKLSGKDEVKKIERWQKIAEVAAKQSGRDLIPNVKNIHNLAEVVNQVKEFDLFLVAYENEQEYTLKQALKNIKINTNDNVKVGFLIGPEGGLDEQEVAFLEQAGAKVITLGKRILRTETVALSITSIIMYELES